PRGEAIPRGSFLACRLSGLEARPQSLGLTAMKPADFARIWQPAVKPDAVAPSYAWSFERGAGTPTLRLQLQTSPGKTQATQEVVWQVGNLQAEVQATVRVTGAGSDLILMEWEVPAAVEVVQVSGKVVRHWSRSDTRLQVWLSRGPPDFELQ